MRKFLASRWLHAAVICCVMVVMMGASDPASRFKKIGHQMICTCSCGQILLECNHVGCPVSGPMIDELHTQLASGSNDTSIYNWFATKYGPIVLASPNRGGFDNVAWIMPFAVFFLATIGTAVVVRAWKMRTPATSETTLKAAGPGNPAADALRERIRRETEY